MQFLPKLLLAAVVCFKFGAGEAYAQDFKIEYLGSISSNSESVVSTSPSGFILMNDSSAIKPCPVLHHLGSKKTIRLCDQGLKGANSVNDNGVVAGWTEKKGNRRAAIWSEAGGLKQIATKFPWSEMVQVNARNQAVGTARFSARICDGDPIDPFCYTENHYRAFTWDEKAGVYYIKPGAYLTKAFGITDSGDAYFTYLSRSSSYRRIGFLTRSKKFHNLPKSDYISEFSEATVNDKGQVLIESYAALLYSRGTGWRKFGQGFTCDRCDNKGLSALGADGQAAVRNGETAFASFYPNAELPISCLVPQNRVIAGSKDLLPRNFGNIEGLGGFLADGSLIFSADVKGDAKFEQLFKLSRPDSSVTTGLNDYCANIFVTSDDCNSNDKCRVHFSVYSSTGTPVPEVELLLSARQVPSFDGTFDCAPIPIRTVSVHNGEGQVDIEFNRKNFDYYLEGTSEALAIPVTRIAIRHAIEDKSTACLPLQ